MLQLMGSQKVDTTQWLNNEQDTCTHLEYVLYIESMKWSEVSQSCLTLCHPMDYSLLGSSVHGIFQARVLEWIAMSFSRGPSRPRNRTQVSRIAGRRFTVWATREALISHSRKPGSKWVTTQLWLSESLRFFGYSSSVYSCHLFLISSASVRFLQFLSFIMPILAWNVPLTSPIFLRKSLAFPILL